MIDFDSVVYTTRPHTLKELILQQLVSRGDWQAVLAYIVSRTNIVSEQALEMDGEDLNKVLGEIAQATIASLKLQNIGKELD